MATSSAVDIISGSPHDAYVSAGAPSKASSVAEITAALCTIPILNGLTDAEYEWLASHGTERKGESGAMVFREGEPACNLNFILEGEIHVRRRHTGPLALFIGRAGQMSGKLPFSRMKGYGGDGYTVGPIWVLDIHEDLFPAMLSAIPSMAQRCVSVLLDRTREVTRMEQQAEKLTALGKLAANLAHELNNPASAAQRSAATLFSELHEYGKQTFDLGVLSNDPRQTQRFMEWIVSTRERLAAFATQSPSRVSPLALSDREEALTKWLSEHGIEKAWSLAPVLAESWIGFDQLDDLAEIVSPEIFPLVLSAFTSSLRAEKMAETVIGSTVRIFDLISAIKDYSYMDQAPIQEIDLAQSLSTTLTMMGSRLPGIQVETQFDPELPPVSAYGSELSQVWTVLIENALDAMRGEGTLRLTTRLTGSLATVEIWDTGPGVDPTLTTRIFEPFFTTKAPGSGLGLGLDTAQRIVARHSGFLTVQSRPGETCFQVRLPLNQAGAY